MTSSTSPLAGPSGDPAPIAALALAARSRNLCCVIIAAGLLAAVACHTQAEAQQTPLQMTAADMAQTQRAMPPQTSMAVQPGPGKTPKTNQIQALQVQTRQSPDFIAFWKHFKQAAAADDRAALQAMTHLPFDLADGNSYDASQFDKIHEQIYDERSRECLSKRLPVPDDEDYDVFCGGTIYIFGTEPDLTPDRADAADGSGWRLLETSSTD